MSLNQRNKKIIWEAWHQGNQQPQNIPALYAKIMHPNIHYNGPQPFNEINGCDALIEKFWKPFLRAFPDIQRRTYLFLGGQVGTDVTKASNVQHWVGGMGDYIGTFANDWLGVPATGQSIHIRFGEFSRLENGKIVEIYTLFDIISLMAQAGYDVLPPSPGRQIWVPGPKAGNGILLEPQEKTESQKTYTVLYNMLFKGMEYHKKDNKKPTMDGYWTEDMTWHGPHGIGSVFGLPDFYKNAQQPIVEGHPDRIGGFHKVRFAEGNCAAMGGLKALRGTHTGAFLGIAPTGNRVTWRIMDFYTRKGDYLHEDWVLIDLIDACQQIGVDLFEKLKVK